MIKIPYKTPSMYLFVKYEKNYEMNLHSKRLMENDISLTNNST